MDQKTQKYTENIVKDQVKTKVGAIPRLKTKITRKDKFNNILARLGVNRMNYSIKPGLFAIGSPTPDSPVLVTANYKLTIDKVRKNLTAIDAWILVLDTKGINVWCAAGEGNFGTQELLDKIQKTELQKLIRHNELILPQLAAPGVNSHKIQGFTDLTIKFGPVKIQDFPQYLQNGKKCDQEMRKVTFSLQDRLKVIPVEFRFILKPLIILLLVIAGLDYLQHQNLTNFTVHNFIPILGAAFTGTLLFPVLLPFLPTRSFAFKGWTLGIIWALIASLIYPGNTSIIISNFALLPPITAYLSLNYTGSTTFTNLSGVKTETKIALPLIAFSLVAGIILKSFIIFQ